MKLMTINDENFKNMLGENDKGGGNEINKSLSDLFSYMSNPDEYQVSIKVAALNQLYSTAIRYIKPVVEKIVDEEQKGINDYTLEDYVHLVDKIATVEWKNEITDKHYKRCNLSFASKYVHFLSKYETPIYDSYIWIVMIGYLNQSGKYKYAFKPPCDYGAFFDTFKQFKNEYAFLRNQSNYNIDKFLWQYGKNLVQDIARDEKLTLGKAKTELTKRIKASC